VHDGRFRDAHVLRHAAFSDVFLEAEDVVHFAHPVLAGFAELALFAGHDLLGDDLVTDLDAEVLFTALAHLLDVTEELVPRNHRRLDPWAFAAPEHRRARVTLAVTGADAAGADADDQLIGTRLGHADTLQTVVFWCMADDGLHGVLCVLFHDDSPFETAEEFSLYDL
jgi:hypothetical protein